MAATTIERLNAALADRYRIERELGQGGMATVYLAADLKHDRKVAIKVLKPELAAVVGKERFLAEIRTTANLRHPHILPLYDSGEADDLLWYAMPYVEGESLRDRLDREKQLPIDEAVAIAMKVAGGLQAAHDAGIVHRDIKPANILLERGEPVVADFGIALAVSEAGGGRLTETGLSVGTPYYMSPEQATGDRDPDARSDLYALAAVLYEMLTGEPPFTGSTAQAVLGRILTGDPAPPTEVRRSVPPHVEGAALKALETLPADRFASAADFATALGTPEFRYGSSETGARGRGEARRGGPGSSGPGSRSGVGTWLGVLGVGAAALLAGLWIGGAGEGAEGPHDVGLPVSAPLQADATNRTLSVAPDGSFVVYATRTGGTTRLWYHSLVSDESRAIPGTEGVTTTPLVDADSHRIVFGVGEELRMGDVLGGPFSSIARVEWTVWGSWGDDGILFFSDDDGNRLRWLDPDSDQRREVDTYYCQNPQLWREGEVLCGGGAQKWASIRPLDRAMDLSATRDLRVRTRSGAASPDDASSPLLRGAAFRIVDEDYLVFTALDGGISATRILDREAGIVGRPVSLVPGVRRQTYLGSGEYDITADGTLVYAPGPDTEVGPLIRRAAMAGGRTVLPLPEDSYLRYQVGPDGRRIAVVVETSEGQELVVHDMETGEGTRLVTRQMIGTPAWAPDGRSLIVSEQIDGVEVLVHHWIDSPEPPRHVLRAERGEGFNTASWLAPDSLLIALGTSGSAFFIDPFADEPRADSLDLQAWFMALSPDRRWLTWGPDGLSDVYVEPWPARDRRWLVSRSAIEPRWLPDGSLIAFAPTGMEADNPIVRIAFDPTQDPPHGPAEVIVRDPLRADTPGWSVAPTPDGDVVYKSLPERSEVSWLRVVPGWVEQMKRAVDEANR